MGRYRLAYVKLIWCSHWARSSASLNLHVWTLNLRISIYISMLSTISQSTSLCSAQQVGGTIWRIIESNVYFGQWPTYQNYSFNALYVINCVFCTYLFNLCVISQRLRHRSFITPPQNWETYDTSTPATYNFILLFFMWWLNKYINGRSSSPATPGVNAAPNGRAVRRIGSANWIWIEANNQFAARFCSLYCSCSSQLFTCPLITMSWHPLYICTFFGTAGALHDSKEGHNSGKKFLLGSPLLLIYRLLIIYVNKRKLLVIVMERNQSSYHILINSFQLNRSYFNKHALNRTQNRAFVSAYSKDLCTNQTNCLRKAGSIPA